jgi:hypothetical protein
LRAFLLDDHSSGMDYFQFLTRLIQEVAPETGQLPPSRMLLFAGSTGANLKEDRRLELWKMGVVVVEDRAQLLEWAESLGSWEAAAAAPEGGSREGSAAPASPQALKCDDSIGATTLQNLRDRLQGLERAKVPKSTLYNISTVNALRCSLLRMYSRRL